MPRQNFSLVHWFPDTDKHNCGYCKQKNTSATNAMWAEMLTVEDYQYLIDRGWRRSGKYCYKPIMHTTCCPSYAIRCNALDFKLSKSQKKIIKRFNKFVKEPDLKAASARDGPPEDPQSSANLVYRDVSHCEISRNKEDAATLCRHVESIEQEATKTESKESEEAPTLGVSLENATQKNAKEPSSLVQPGVGADQSKPPCKKAKLIRLEKRQQKLASKGIESVVKVEKSVAPSKSLEDFLNEIDPNCEDPLKVVLVRSDEDDAEFKKLEAQEYALYVKYQMRIHGDSPTKCTEKQFARFLVNSPLQVKLVRMDSEESSFEIEAELYAKYQAAIHGDSTEECSPDNFREFLVETPLEPEYPSEGPSHGLGSFHQQYWLGDKLIAVGVIDILPECVSSVYFFYDPDYLQISPGTFGSLKEIAFVRSLNASLPNIKYYYLGLYIHSCPKMRYKANMTPSSLLCPETYEWVPVEKSIILLDISAYSRLNEDQSAIDVNLPNAESMDRMAVLVKRDGVIQFSAFKRKFRRDIHNYNLLAKLLGQKCLRNVIVVHSF